MTEKNNWEAFCLTCTKFDKKTSICTEFKFNVKDYPNRFDKKCSGKYYVSESGSSKDIIQKELERGTMKQCDICKQPNTKYNIEKIYLAKKINTTENLTPFNHSYQKTITTKYNINIEPEKIIVCKQCQKPGFFNLGCLIPPIFLALSIFLQFLLTENFGIGIGKFLYFSLFISMLAWIFMPLILKKPPIDIIAKKELKSRYENSEYDTFFTSFERRKLKTDQTL